ncbi:hypothetical protein [Pimelobacter simplex]|uniref:hypothetical protein n=1 Tax=Nocardioides simplex TaxID=2045 RepID=UPI003AACE280
MSLLLRVATLLVAVTATGPAAPAPSRQTTALCADAKVACSVQVVPAWTEGTAEEVAVTGRPGVTVGVRAFRVRTSGGRVTALVPFGPVAKVSTDDRGFGVASLRMPVVGADETGGPVLLALEDSAGTDLSTVLGTWSVLASRRPLVLGDGYADAKPVGEALGLALTAAVPGTVFDVELDRDGAWESIASGTAPCGDADDECVVGYEVPRGLAARPYDVRLVNEATGAPVATWSVLPSATGTSAARQSARPAVVVGDAVPGALAGSGAGTDAVPRPRSRSLDVADVGTDVAGAADPAGFDQARVRWVAGGLALAAALAAAAGVARAGGPGRSVRRSGGRRG